MKERIEKIEIAKKNGTFYFTGVLTTDPDNSDWVLINTTRGEELRFRKEQVQGRRALDDTNGADTNGKKKRNKNLQV